MPLFHSCDRCFLSSSVVQKAAGEIYWFIDFCRSDGDLCKNTNTMVIFVPGADKKDDENLQKFGEESQKPVSWHFLFTFKKVWTSFEGFIYAFSFLLLQVWQSVWVSGILRSLRSPTKTCPAARCRSPQTESQVKVKWQQEDSGKLGKFWHGSSSVGPLMGAAHFHISTIIV